MKGLLHSVMRYFGLSMAALYIGLSVFFLFFINQDAGIPDTYRIAFAILLFIYGIFRMYRYFYPSLNDEEENEN